MKKILLMVMAMPLLFSCGENIEEKVPLLLKDYFAQHTDKEFVYEPVSFDYDTLYNSVLFRPGVKDTLSAYMRLQSRIELKEADNNYMLDKVPYVVGTPQYSEIVNKTVKNNIYIDSLKQIQNNIADFVEQESKLVDVNDIYGWKVTHIYKFKKGVLGPFDGKCTFFVDEKADSIIWGTVYQGLYFNDLFNEFNVTLADIKKKWSERNKTMDELHKLGI